MSMFESHANGGFDVTLFLYYGQTDLAALLFKVKNFYLLLDDRFFIWNSNLKLVGMKTKFEPTVTDVIH